MHVGRAVELEGWARWGTAIALGAGILAVRRAQPAVAAPVRYGPMEWLTIAWGDRGVAGGA